MSQNPTEALLEAAVAEQHAGRSGEARKLFEKVLRGDPRHPAALHYLSILHLQAGEIEPGLQLIRRNIAYHPGDAGAHNNLGNALSFAGRREEAIAAYGQAIALRPDYAAAYVHRGMAHAGLERPQAAAADFRAALRFAPNEPDIWGKLAVTLGEIGQYAEALGAFEKVLTLSGPSAQAWFGRATCLQKLGRSAEALIDFDRVLAIEPAMIEALFGRAITLQALLRPQEALVALDRGLALDPEVVELRTARANALMDLRRFDEALAEYNRVLEAQANYGRGFSNRGTAHQDMGRLDLAMADYSRAIALDPADPEPKLNLAFCTLLAGDYEAGFEQAEIRWSAAQGRARDRKFTKPVWLGESDLEGRRILLYPDQGFGDTLQFCRYAPLVAQRGGRVMLEVQPALQRLLQGLDGVETLAPLGSPLPDHDLQCPLASLPHAFRTTLQTIPPAPYLPVPQAQADAWAAKLGPRKARRIGLAWSGNRENRFNPNRIVPQQALIDAMPGGVEFYNLQVEMVPGEEAALERAGVIRADRDIVDFADTAGLLSQLDLIVSVDTSLAHLAGALGRPAWILVAYAPDWRWGMSGEDSPWYPSLRLLRQARPADWSAALSRLRADLAAWAKL